VPKSDADPTSVRSRYERLGATDYYRAHGADYANPHADAVRDLVHHAVRAWAPDTTRTLDLAAGAGEVTLALRELGVTTVEAIDPYTHAAYARATGGVAEQLTFEQIADGALAGRRYTLIACSFALHLVEKSRLPQLAYQLSLVADALLIITPHKRPEVRPEWGWRLAHEHLLHRVRGRLYKRDDGVGGGA